MFSDETSSETDGLEIVQRQLLSQGQDIERFLNKTTENSESSRLLRTLFDLFKTELSVNLNLRKNILTQKQKISKYESAYGEFISKMQSKSKKPIKTYNDVVEFFAAVNRKYQNTKKSLESVTESMTETAEKEAQSALELAEFKRKYAEESNRVKYLTNQLESDRSKDMVAKLQSEVLELKTSSTMLETENKTLRESMTSRDMEILNLKKENSELKTRISDAEDVMRDQFEKFKAKTSIESKLELSEDRIAALESENMELKSRLREANATIDKQYNRIHSLETRVATADSLEKQVEAMENQLDAYKASKRHTEKKRDELKTRVVTLEEKINEAGKLKQSLDEKEAVIDQLKRENNDIKQQLYLINEDIKVSDASSLSEASDFQKEIESLAQEISSLKKDLGRRAPM